MQPSVRVACGRSSAGSAAVSIKFYGLWLGCDVSSLIPHKSPPGGASICTYALGQLVMKP